MRDDYIWGWGGGGGTIRGGHTHGMIGSELMHGVHYPWVLWYSNMLIPWVPEVFSEKSHKAVRRGENTSSCT